MHSQMSVTSPTTPTSKSNPSQFQSTSIVKQLAKNLGDFNLNVDNDDFTSEQFDVKQFSSAIIKTSQLSEHLSTLSQNINILDKEIREQVSEHHEDLLHQAINIETLEEMLDMIQMRIASLKSTSERLRLKISTPYNELNLRILQLSRLQAACDTLRRIKGILFYSSKLRVQMQMGLKDIVKAAQSLNELDFLLKNFDSSGIDIIEADVHFAYKSRREVEEQAQIILEKGMIHQDQTQIGTALQVFYSLGVLDRKLIECLKTSEKNFQKLCQDLLDSTNLTLQSTSSTASNLHTSASSSAFLTTASTAFISNSQVGSQFPGRSTMPNVGSMSQFRAQIWTNMEKLMDSMYDSCSQIIHLQQILEKKKDLLTNILYLDEIDFSAIFDSKMYLVNLVSQENSSPVTAYESICSIIQDANEINSKKSIEFLYDQWRIYGNVLNASILSACTQSNYIKQTFQNEFPKLLKLVNDVWLRLLQLNPLIDRYRYLLKEGTTQTTQTKGVNTLQSGVNINLLSNFATSYDLLRKCFQDLENSYLNRSLSHLFDPINLIFSQGTDKPINRNDIDTFIKGIQTQLQTLQYDLFNSSASSNSTLNLVKTQTNLTQNLTFTSCSSAFSDKVISNVCKSIQMYSNKSEQLLNNLNSELQQSISSSSSSTTSGTNSSGTGISSSNIFYYSSGLPYQIQMKNLEFVNQTHELYEQLSRLFTGNEHLNKRQEEKLGAALKSLTVFEENSLGPYVLSASDCILAIILTMHQEDFSNPNSNSLYMRELNQVMQRIAQNYLQLYNCKTIVSQFLNQLSIRCVDLFIRHASILRPITDSARHRLLNDSLQIESVVQNLLATKLTDLGSHYKHLKAFRTLLKLDSTEIIENEASLSKVLDESLPYHVLLQYLFAYAPTELRSPHQSLDWPLAKYSDWLDKHANEKERLMVTKTCLETYVNLVRQKKEKKFAPIYPIMFRLLEKGLQSVVTPST